jgi:hypothetical protein
LMGFVKQIPRNHARYYPTNYRFRIPTWQFGPTNQ